MEKPSNKRQRSKDVPTASAVRSEHTLIEMALRKNGRETTLLVAERDTIRETGAFATDAGERLVPYSADNNLLVHRVVLLPSEATEYGTEADLLAELRAFIHHYVDLPETFEEIAAHYALYTWIYDVFQEAPYLRVRGDYGSGKSRFLLTVGSLCYKPIFASGASTTSPIFRILDAFRGTLVIDESDFRFSDEKADIIKILNNGNAVGFPVLRSDATPQKEFNPRAFSVFGPKIIASRNLFEDRALESRCISEEMGSRRPRPEIPFNLPQSFHEEARDLRNKLLLFRFRNFRLPRDLATARDPHLEPRVAQILAPLLATVSDPLVQERLRELGRRQCRDLQADRGLSMEAQVLDVLGECLARPATPTVQDIANRFAERYGAEMAKPVTARWMGWFLRARLGLPLTRTNSGFSLSQAAGPLLRSLGEKYGVVNIVNVGEVSNGVAPTEEAAA
jgi:hypothetical protein